MARRVAVGRIKGRCSFELSRDGGARGIEGALRGRTGAERGRERKQRSTRAGVDRGKKRGCRVRGGSNGADGPEGRRWVAMLRWVEATTSKSDFRSTCYASASSTLRIPSILPSYPSPSSDRTRYVPSRIILATRSLSRTSRYICWTPSSRFDISSTFAYFVLAYIIGDTYRVS